MRTVSSEIGPWSLTITTPRSSRVCTHLPHRHCYKSMLAEIKPVSQVTLSAGDSVPLRKNNVGLRRIQKRALSKRFVQRVRSFSFPGSTPTCGGFFFQDERVQITTHVRPRKKTATHRGRPRGAKRTHPMFAKTESTPCSLLQWGCADRQFLTN